MRNEQWAYPNSPDRQKPSRKEREWHEDALNNPKRIKQNVQTTKDSWDRGIVGRAKWDRTTVEMGITFLFYALQDIADALERIEEKLDAQSSE